MATAPAPLPPLSASVTRILALTGFPPELKTKDIQAAFGEYETVNGGFKIKWVDDTSLLLVFNDAGVAKRAYLQTILSPPASLVSPDGTLNLRIKPYEGADAQTIIFSVNNRRNTRGGSMSVPNGHARGVSLGGPAAGGARTNWKAGTSGNGLAASMHAPNGGSSGEGGSPTIPNLPTQPTLDSLINSSLPEITSPAEKAAISTGGASTPPPRSNPASATEPSPPRMGDSARRMVGAALGLKHPSLTPRRSAEPSDTLNKAMGGLVIAE